MPLLALVLVTLLGAFAALPAAAEDVCARATAAIEREKALPPRLLHSISLAESGRWDKERRASRAWPWTINAEGNGQYFPTKAEAIAAVRTLQARGVRSIDVGCMQVNLHHHPAAFATLETAFDPVENARYAAGFLSELRGQTGSWARAIAHYHSAKPERGGPYWQRVAVLLYKEYSDADGPAATSAAAASPAVAPPVRTAVLAPRLAPLASPIQPRPVTTTAFAPRPLDVSTLAPVSATATPVTQLRSTLVRPQMWRAR